MKIKYTRKMTLSPVAKREIEKFIAYMGTIKKASEALNVSRTMMYNWANGTALVSPTYAAKMEVLSDYLCSKDTLMIRQLAINSTSEVFLNPEDKYIDLYDYIKKYYVRPKVNQFDMTSEEYFQKCVHPDLIKNIKEFELKSKQEITELTMFCSAMFGGTETYWDNIVEFFKNKSVCKENNLQKN